MYWDSAMEVECRISVAVREVVVLLSGMCVTDWMVKPPASAIKETRRAPWNDVQVSLVVIHDVI